MTKTILAVAAALMLNGGVAHADGADDAFLNAVHGQGITDTSGGDRSLINYGHTICTRRAAGDSESWIIEMLPPPPVQGGYYGRNTLRVIVHSAEAAYCPEYIQ